MKRIYPNKIEEYNFINKEDYSVEKVVNDYIFRTSENTERATFKEYIKIYGDPTNELWNKIESLNAKFITSLERTLNLQDTDYSNFIVTNIEQFRDRDKEYRKVNQSVFFSSLDIKELNDEAFVCDILGLENNERDISRDLEKIKSKYYFKDSEDSICSIKKDYVSTYGYATGKLFTKLEIFYSQLLSIFEDAMKVKDENSYVKSTIENIDDFLNREQKYLNTHLKGVNNEF